MVSYIENKAMVYSDEVLYDVIRPYMSWGVLQICNLENDGTIKVASVHVVHGLQAH